MDIRTLSDLRADAITHSLFPPTTLRAAVRRLGFVQADPIRSPARAQDLILRHRVRNYRAGDLERKYGSLKVEEDYLYAYGFLSRVIWEWVHPRVKKKLTAFEKRVLDVVTASGPMHPRDMEEHFGRARVINAWGGYSKATTHALVRLQYYGLLRVVKRENGIRLYEGVVPSSKEISPKERLTGLTLAVANVLSPAAEKTLLANLYRFRHLGNVRQTVEELTRSGRLEKVKVDGVGYFRAAAGRRFDDVQDRVWFLAPFDPVVWDRRRFEHLWGWPYRFEAYTPSAARIRGYYSMPVLWRDDVVGWANAAVAGGHLDVQVGFVRRPQDKTFQTGLDAEIARLECFLHRKPCRGGAPSG